MLGLAYVLVGQDQLNIAFVVCRSWFFGKSLPGGRRCELNIVASVVSRSWLPVGRRYALNIASVKNRLPPSLKLPLNRIGRF